MTVAPNAAQVAVARDMTNSAVMEPPAKKKLLLLTQTSATEASVATTFSWPMVEVCKTPAENAPAALAPSDEAS